MPYKAKGVWVYVKRNNRWVRLKKHTTSGKAARHARALNANVRH